MARSRGSCTSRKTKQEALQKACEETARAKRFRSNSYGLPASSLLLLAWRLKKNGAAARALHSRECVRTVFSPGSGKARQGHENRRPAARNRSGATRNKARARGEPSPGPPASERRTQDHWATSPAAGPRCARGPRAGKRPRPRKRASLARCKIWPRTWI